MSAPPFDEAFDSAAKLRPAYAALRRRMSGDPLRPAADVCAQLAARPLDDEARILPVPLCLDASEHDLILTGSAQRAHALQAFFCDLVLGERRFGAAAGGPGEGELEAILGCERTSLARLRRAWSGRDQQDVRFVYGPDLAREPGGSWLVIEDNVGCVGGAADGFFVAQAYAAASGLRAADMPPADLPRAVERWRKVLPRAPGAEGVVAVAGCDSGESARGTVRLLEDARRLRLLEAASVDVVDERGLLRLLGSAAWPPRAVVNFGSPQGRLRRALHDRQHVALLNAPGTGLLGNKALLPYVDGMIRFFLDEEPVLATAPTRILCDRALPEPAAGWVVKTATGSGGRGVFVLRDASSERLADACAAIAGAGPCGTVAQQWIEFSTLPPHPCGGGEASKVELRALAYVLGPGEVCVGRQLLGKSVAAGDRSMLNNVSRGASYVAVLRMTPAHESRDSG